MTEFEKVCFYCEYWQEESGRRSNKLQAGENYAPPDLQALCTAPQVLDGFWLIQGSLVHVPPEYNYTTLAQNVCNVYEKTGGLLGIGSKIKTAFTPFNLEDY